MCRVLPAALRTPFSVWRNRALRAGAIIASAALKFAYASPMIVPALNIALSPSPKESRN